jgi:acetolactate synthase-1/2/3 large subunit
VRPTYGGLGVGIGETIGLKIAEPQRTVVLVIGDGSFNYNPVLAGLGLCQEYNLSIMIVILNNGGYMAMKTGHDRLYPQGAAASSGDYLGVKITPAPDYVKIAQAFTAQAEQIKQPKEIEAALVRSAQALKAGRTVLLDVISV